MTDLMDNIDLSHGTNGYHQNRALLTLLVRVTDLNRSAGDLYVSLSQNCRRCESNLAIGVACHTPAC